MKPALKKGENEAENLSQMNGRKVRANNPTSNCSLQLQWTLMKMNTKECRIKLVYKRSDIWNFHCWEKNCANTISSLSNQGAAENC